MSPGQKHCSIITKNGETTVKCTECDWSNTYDDGVVAKRMASNHIVKKHPDIAKPASAQPSEPKRLYAPRKPRIAADLCFCPRCGTNLNAVRVALSLS